MWSWNNGLTRKRAEGQVVACERTWGQVSGTWKASEALRVPLISLPNSTSEFYYHYFNLYSSILLGSTWVNDPFTGGTQATRSISRPVGMRESCIENKRGIHHHCPMRGTLLFDVHDYVTPRTKANEELRLFLYVISHAITLSHLNSNHHIEKCTPSMLYSSTSAWNPPPTATSYKKNKNTIGGLSEIWVNFCHRPPNTWTNEWLNINGLVLVAILSKLRRPLDQLRRGGWRSWRASGVEKKLVVLTTLMTAAGQACFFFLYFSLQHASASPCRSPPSSYAR